MSVQRFASYAQVNTLLHTHQVHKKCKIYFYKFNLEKLFLGKNISWLHKMSIILDCMFETMSDVYRKCHEYCIESRSQLVGIAYYFGNLNTLDDILILYFKCVAFCFQNFDIVRV